MMKKLLMILTVVLLFLAACGKDPVSSSGNSPSDHTVNKHRVMHKSGLTNPTTNCVSCHGPDLKGGDVGVSCYSCHGKKW